MRHLQRRRRRCLSKGANRGKANADSAAVEGDELDDVEITDDGWSWVDMAGSGSEEDRTAWLKYYATEDDRRQWTEEFPEDPVPPAERPPFDRDRHLPHVFEP